MKNALSLTMFVCSLVWCATGSGEEKKIDPGVINGWMRSAETSDSDNSEVKRILHSTTMDGWTRSRVAFHVRYEVTNSDCHRTLTFYTTDEHGHSWDEEWVTLIEHDAKRESSELENPMVLVKSQIVSEKNSPIMDLNVEYQVHEGLPALVVSDQRDVVRTLSAFKRGEYARIRVSAFEHDQEYDVDLRGFADKVGWSNKHCPLAVTESNSKKEVPAS